eukprot:TRINITY_DN104937_c0_g1_i1.p1 TRINITY_DN104937_c0_g1~~TRINITY_DN104937_c0_g1_i1.p1  ORF type:complete len:134 (+),score=14.89 TRINITY_DN104937_c0_g1_i1:109-510(+)
MTSHVNDDCCLGLDARACDADGLGLVTRPVTAVEKHEHWASSQSHSSLSLLQVASWESKNWDRSETGSLSFCWQPTPLNRRLPSQIDSDLLRAVSLTEVLRDFGKRLSGAAGTQADYEVSQPVGEIDYFVSHD